MTVAIIDARERQFVIIAQGIELLAPIVAQAEAARDAVKPLSGSGAPSADLGIDGSVYYDTADPLNPVLYGPKVGSAWGPPRPLRGPSSPADNVAATLLDLKAAPILRDTMLFDRVPFKWMVGDFTGQADESDTVQSDLEPITDGAWVRQPASSIRNERGGTVQSAIEKVPYPKSVTGSLSALYRRLNNYVETVSDPLEQYDFGSSVGNGAALPSGATQNPGAYFHQRLVAHFDKLGIYNFTRTNGSVDGSILTDMDVVFRDLIAPSGAAVSFGVPGMNDFAIAGWNTGQTLPGAEIALRSLLGRAQAAGITVVLSTTPHPRLPALDYDFFAQNPAIPQLYPVSVAAPVDPETEMIPPESQSKPFIDWKDTNGVIQSIQVDHRYLRGNEIIRKVAADFGCALVDAERKQFRLLADGYTYDDMYADTTFPAEIVHPNLWCIQNTYWAAIDDLFDGLEADEVQNTPRAAIGSRLRVNREQDDGVYAARIRPVGGDDILLLETQAGVAKITVDDLGIAEFVGDSIGLPPRVRRLTGRDPSLGSTYDDFRGATNIGAAQPETFTVPANASGEMLIRSEQPGIGIRTQKRLFQADGSSITMGPEFGAVGGSTACAITTSGLTVSVAPIADNTSLKIIYRVW